MKRALGRIRAKRGTVCVIFPERAPGTYSPPGGRTGVPWKKGTGTESTAFPRRFGVRCGLEPVPIFHSTQLAEHRIRNADVEGPSPTALDLHHQ